MVIGYRPPHKGQEKIAALRAAYEAHQQELLDAEVKKYQLNIQPIDYAIPAIRAWDISPNGLLRSLAVEMEWESPVQREAYEPRFRGSSGFWAVKPSCIEIIDNYDPQVVGTVELSGTVVEHELGWRAEVCVIQALYILPQALNMSGGPLYQLQPDPDLLERTYQCDVHYLESIYHATGKLLK